MPEGPFIIIIKEEVAAFAGKKVLAVSGNSSIDQSLLLNKKVVAFKSLGKHLLICFKGFTLKVHFYKPATKNGEALFVQIVRYCINNF